MTLDEVIKIDNLSERTREFSRLPKEEQDKVFSPLEKAMVDVCSELEGRYMERQRIAGEMIAKLVEGNEAAKLTMWWVLHHIAAHELRLEVAGVPIPERSPLPLLFSREAIDKMKAEIRQEICEA